MDKAKLVSRFIYRCQCALNVREEPPFSNRGPEVDIYQLHYGKKYLGTYWCAMILGYEYDQARVELGLGPGFRINPSCSQLIRDAKKAGLIREAPVVGGLVVFGTRHVGIITGVETHDEPRVILTIEGNTSPTPGVQPNGGGVYPKKHDITSEMTFIEVCA